MKRAPSKRGPSPELLDEILFKLGLLALVLLAVFIEATK